MTTSRRQFLRTSLGASTLLALGPTAPAFLGRTARAAAAQRSEGDTVLVIVQLSGGNDGLNTIVPYDDDVYGRSRRTLRLTAGQVHKIGDGLGFHPEMKPLARLWNEGRLSVVQGVGYPNSDRNHPGAMQDWHNGRPGAANVQTGWLGRAIDAAVGEGTAGVPGVFVGQIAQPFALNAEKAVVPTVRELPAAAGDGGERRRLVEAAGAAPRDGENPLLDFVRRSALAACASADKIEAAAREVPGAGQYPPYQFARELQTIAQLVRAGVGIRIFYAELGGGGIGGFDNHANQRDNHAALLRQLSESIAAFADDLGRDKTLDRVLLMTFSEFGRTVSENGRRGTDHGAAQPVLLAGGRLKGGLIGTHPSLTELEGDAQKHHTDFRRLYATALKTWLGFDARAVLYGDYEPMEIVRG